jgi:DNA polymerase-3 subunit alpha
VLLAKNYDGYKNIIELVSLANLERPGDKPYILWEELKNYSKDLMCLS